ncbi:FecR domain-containing protein [Pannonibacter phragmitetus]|uniref:FecR domain-containing protein n=1 Tax=Pannonibacter phragmitetus TaxID=121719 RepID=UPI000F448E70|nr:FecR domain-containing protein [Pannonibacter phragmitetus]
MMSRFRTARSLAAAVSLLPALLASTAMAATDVGVATAVNPQAQGTAPGAGVRTIMLGNNIYHNERIRTGGTGLVQVLFVDGSTFTVGANSDLVIDEFVFDPEAGTGKLVASMGKGVARFVGGKLSKNKGGVNVRTPVGTIGIRGGIANLEVREDGGTFSLVFGKELTFTGPSGTGQRIYEPGYTMVVGGRGSGLPEIRPTTQADLGSLQQSLTSRPGQNGGAPRPPTNEIVARSGIPSVNSNLSTVNTLPSPKPQVVVATELGRVEDAIEKTPRPDVSEGNGGTAPAIPVPRLHALSGGSWLELPWPHYLSDPGRQGVLGKGGGAIDGELVLEGSLSGGTSGAYSSANGDSVLTGEIDGQIITVGVPSMPGISYFQSALTDKGYHIGQISQSGVPSWLSVDAGTDGNIETNGRGVFYRGSGDFIALLYQEAFFPGDMPYFGTDLSDAILAFGGTAGSFDVMDQGDLRTYTLTADLQQLLSAGMQNSDGSVTVADTGALFLNPLVAQDLGASFLSGVGNTGLLVLESDAGAESTPPPLALAASFSIQGSGSSQQSMVSLFLGSITENYFSGTMTLDGDRRGGYKSASHDATGNFSGGIGSLEGVDGAHAYGSNAQNFLLSGNASGNIYVDSYAVVPSTISASEQYSASTHIAELSSSADGSTLTRTTRNLSAFAAGMVQQGSGGTLVVTPYASQGTFDNTVRFDAASKSLSASFSLSDQSYTGAGYAPKMTVSFGNSASAPESERASVFIDNDRYAAIETSDSLGNGLRDDAGTNKDADAKSYFISNTLVEGADSAIFAGVTTKCSCAFLEWGYWGTSLVTDNPYPAADDVAQVHLGTWAAGRILGPNDLPSSGSASYQGHAVGSVVNGGSQYLAAGDFNMSVDFASRHGTATISNFDGRTFGANVSESNPFADQNLFSGAIFDSGTMGGTFNASLVQGPNSNFDGVIGNFSAIDGSWMATGVAVGERLP